MRQFYHKTFKTTKTVYFPCFHSCIHPFIISTGYLKFLCQIFLLSNDDFKLTLHLLFFYQQIIMMPILFFKLQSASIDMNKNENKKTKQTEFLDIYRPAIVNMLWTIIGFQSRFRFFFSFFVSAVMFMLKRSVSHALFISIYLFIYFQCNLFFHQNRT